MDITKEVYQDVHQKQQEMRLDKFLNEITADSESPAKTVTNNSTGTLYN